MHHRSITAYLHMLRYHPSIQTMPNFVMFTQVSPVISSVVLLNCEPFYNNRLKSGNTPELKETGLWSVNYSHFEIYSLQIYTVGDSVLFSTGTKGTIEVTCCFWHVSFSQIASCSTFIWDRFDSFLLFFFLSCVIWISIQAITCFF